MVRLGEKHFDFDFFFCLSIWDNSTYVSSVNMGSKLQSRNFVRPLVPPCGNLNLHTLLVCQCCMRNWFCSAGSAHKDLVGVYENRHSHLQTRGVFLLCTAHMDQPHKVQVISLLMNSTFCLCHADELCVTRLCALFGFWGFLFSDEELDNRNAGKQFVELDSLDTEKALLLSDDDDDPLWVCSLV